MGSRPLRVLHFGKFHPRYFGGIETHVKGLTEGQAAAGLDVTNLVYDRDAVGNGPSEERVNDVRLVAVPCRGTLASLALAPSLPAVTRRLSAQAPFDVVHAHFPDPFAFACLPLAKGAARVASWHSDIVRQRWFGALYGAAARTLFDPLAAVAGATTSHLASPQIESFRPRLRRVVPYGVDVARFSATPETTARAARLHEQAGARPIVFAVGRHVYYKGFDVLIDAMRSVDAVLLLGGHGPLTSELEARAAAAGSGDRVRFVGRIEEADLPAYYHACAVFCLPSLATSEAFGLVQVEAMACARPIVNCRLNNAVNEVAPDGVCAVTVAPGDPAALATALSALLARPDRAASLGEQGRARVERCYSMRAMVDASLTMYAQVLA